MIYNLKSEGLHRISIKFTENHSPAPHKSPTPLCIPGKLTTYAPASLTTVMDDMDENDERHMELETLEAIYPEIQKITDTTENLAFSLEIPVQPASPATVTFPVANNNNNPAQLAAAENAEDGQAQRDSHELAHLPALKVQISLPQGYPADKPPQVTISTTPPWIIDETRAQLEAEGPEMWEELGHNMVAFDYIDHIQQASERIFGLADEDGTLKIDALHKIAILDYDIKARQAAFEKETFDCGVCLEPKKGTVCHKMTDCGHVFCKACLQDFYGTAITEGDLTTVRCLTPNCAKERAEAQARSQNTSRKRKVKTFINPSELLQIGLSHELVTRYVSLKYKTELESDKNTIYCPRTWCDGAARSKKHKKPEGLELVSEGESEEDEEEGEEGGGDGNNENRRIKKKPKKGFDSNDLLAICEDCGFAFCSRCLQSWHGEFVRCAPKRDTDEITAEEQASIDYMALHTSPCPTCAAPAQKTHGCNHMICFRCNSHFCYLCSAWLDPSNPYQHYNLQPGGKVTSCYMRLWELEGGDGDDVGYAFEGGNGPPPAPAAVAVGAPPVVLEEEEDLPHGFIDESDSADEDEEAGQGGEDARRGQEVPGAVAREGPLVLRIGGEAGGRDRHAAVPPPVPQAPQAAAGRGRGRGRARGGRGADGRGNRGGGGPRGGVRQNVQGQQQPARRGNRNQQQRVPVVGVQPHVGNAGEGELDPAHEAWIRHFIELALNDEEDDDELFERFGR